MNVQQLIAQAEDAVPADAVPGTRHRAQGAVTTDRGRFVVEVVVRVDRLGRRREQHFCDGTRLSRPALLRLTCAESACPQAQAVQAQWAAFHRRTAAPGPAPSRPAAPQPQPLLTDIDVEAAGHRCIARPARFSCYTACPNDAHPPMRLEHTGFDLFEDGRCIGGGLAGPASRRRPRLPTLAAVEAYLLARRLEALAQLGAIAMRAR